MPEAARHLHVIDGSTGEVLPGGCPMCAAKDDVIAGLERDVRGWASRYALLKREKDKQAKEDPLWPVLEALYGLWRRECGHMRSRFSTDDFWAAQSHYERYGWDGCETAIAGARFDCWRTKRRNGSMKRHDDWAKNIFKDRASVEEMMKRAPEGFVPQGLPERFTSAERGKC
jgi:hypothetical protein